MDIVQNKIVEAQYSEDLIAFKLESQSISMIGGAATLKRSKLKQQR